MAEEELVRIAHLTKQTLGFYREQAGIVQVYAGELLRQLIFVLSPKARNKQVNLDLELANDPEILVNAGEIRQLFANFLSNSIDACNPGGSIRIRVSRHFSHRLRLPWFAHHRGRQRHRHKAVSIGSDYSSHSLPPRRTLAPVSDCGSAKRL